MNWNYRVTELKFNIQYYGLKNQQPQLYEPTFQDFINWVLERREIQFDVETNVTDNVRERVLITVQFGSVNDPVPMQWVLQWSYLKEEEKKFIKTVLEDRWFTKIIHNAAFEIMVFLNYGVRIRNVYDTMIIEQVLLCGYDAKTGVGYGLDDVVLRRLFAGMDKTDQTSFGDNILTGQKIKYAALDVVPLDKIKNLQLIELSGANLEYVAALENESIIGLAQMQWEGLKLNKERWLENLEWALPELQKAEEVMNEWLKKEPFASAARKLGYVCNEDRLRVNWKSNPQKREVVSYLWPDCPGATKPVLKKYIPKADPDYTEMIWQMAEGNFKPIEEHLVKNHRSWLISKEFLIPAGTSTINWNSVDQVLPIMQAENPRLKDLSAETMGRFIHPIALDYESFKERIKLISDYGENYFKYVDPDGNVRTRFNPIATTGRLKSSDPNMQNINVKDFVGMRYRNCFEVPYPDFVFVSGDYVSQELVVIAYLTQDKNWLEALRKGQDLHSIASELVFRDHKNPYKISWEKATEKDCAYYKQVVNAEGKLEFAKQKCNCKLHKKMRYDCKTINFMLAYGGTKFRLAAELKISLKDSDMLIQDYYKAMPAIGRTMTFLGHFGIKNGYIQTLAPFFRKRWFPKWQEKARFVEEHLAGVREDRDLASIEKEAKNQPVQGSSADQVKVAICMVMWELDEKGLHDQVKLLMQVHDQLDTGTHKDVAETWKPRLQEIMEEAALINIPTGLLKADVQITEVWSK